MAMVVRPFPLPLSSQGCSLTAKGFEVTKTSEMDEPLMHLLNEQTIISAKLFGMHL